MDIELTAATQRALLEASAWSMDRKCRLLEAPAVLLGLLTEPECKAAITLASCQIDEAAVCRQWPALRREDGAATSDTQPVDPDNLTHLFSPEVVASFAAADAMLADLPHPLTIATEHLLLGLAGADHEVAHWLRQNRLDCESLLKEILRQYGIFQSTLPAPDDRPGVCSSPPSDQIPSLGSTAELPRPAEWVAPSPAAGPATVGDHPALVRLLDASVNRAREALRVVEDYTRFVLDDSHLTERLKVMRHEFHAALAGIALADRLAMRDTPGDVGTKLTTAAEQTRRDAEEVLAANFTRLQEALRSLEEFGKIGDSKISRILEGIRYESYSLQKAVLATHRASLALYDARLYVLIDGRESGLALERLAASLIEAGVDLLQLRDKRLNDRDLLERARCLRCLTRPGRTRFVMNDRPDLAVLSGADGVHVGQDELEVREVRRIVGPRMLVGVSTHTIEQARQAVLDGADYLGVGPMFPSGTKRFARFPGLEFARQVGAEISLPAFAIGGVDQSNAAELVSAGISRIAVSGAILGAGDPAAAARRLLEIVRRDVR